MEEENGKAGKVSQLSMANTTPNNKKMPTSNSKRLLFDRRYGWVIDDWKNPSQEAFAGGRGMFCVVPLAKGLAELASYSINSVVNSTIKILEKRDPFCPRQFQATIGNQLQQLNASIQKPNFSLLMFKGKHGECGKLQDPETA
ncbi:Aspartate--ammonia ligase [Bienertia sinuspersici]